jgi:hypothetical protein
VEHGSFLYAADGMLQVRPAGGVVHEAVGNEWRDAAVAMDRNLDIPVVRELLPLYQSGLLLPPEEQ